MDRHAIDLVVRIEWLAIAVLALVAYWLNGASWLLFAVLILAPDLSMVGYLGGPRLGAICYNIAHILVLPIALVAYGLLADQQTIIGVGLIWILHIAGDRALGYGLKSAAGFNDTHLGRIGRD